MLRARAAPLPQRARRQARATSLDTCGPGSVSQSLSGPVVRHRGTPPRRSVAITGRRFCLSANRAGRLSELIAAHEAGASHGPDRSASGAQSSADGADSRGVVTSATIVTVPGFTDPSGGTTHDGQGNPTPTPTQARDRAAERVGGCARG